MKNKLILILILTATFVGCNDDYLDTKPLDEISAENFFNTESDLDLYINSLHEVPDGYAVFYNDQGTDNITTSGATELKNVIIGNPTAQNITTGWSWAKLRNINYFLEHFGKAGIDEDTKMHFEGLARYYRAEFYFNKVKRYSDVPWYSKTLGSTDKDLYKARDSRSLVLDKIIEDIQFASKNIRSSVTYGNINKWAALHLQTRIALYEGTYRKYHPELSLQASANTFFKIAESAAKEIMDSGNFEIFNNGNPNTSYEALFQTDDLSTISEVILANVHDVKKDKTSGWSTAFGDYEISPTKSIIQAYLMKDGTRYSAQAGYKNFGFVEEFTNRDPRLTQTFVGPKWVSAGQSSPYIQVLNKNFSGYHQHKGYNNTREAAGVDIAIFRYAETLVSYAEAKAELMTLTQADLDISINLLRRRVGIPNLMLTAANASIDPVLETKYPNVSSANKGVILEIRRERRVEFAAENYRYDDLMRWSAGKLLEKSPLGIYFKGLGKYDMTADGIDDIILISSNATIPSPLETNSLGVSLIYYKVGDNFADSNVNIVLSNGNSGSIVTEVGVTRTFVDPKYYYRPIPSHQLALNPNLKQIMGW